MNGDTVRQIIIMVILIFLSAFFSATETAFSSLNKTRLKTMVENGDEKAGLTLKLAEKYEKLISTILIGNNLVNIAVAAIGTVLFVRVLGDIGATVSTVVITVAVLIFGEITPKSIAKNNPEKFAIATAPFINFLLILLTPINFFFTLWQKFVNKIFNVEYDSKISQEELLMIVDEVEQDGSLDEDESDLVRNAIEFGDLKAEDILTHRVDLEAISIDTSKEEIAKIFTESGFSRLLVYDESIDNIIGVLHQKDFYIGTGINKKSLKSIITPPLFIHKSECINDLLKLLQKEKSHIAIVVDEYGGTLGIVTMEDILEELVGDIWDEHDEVIEDFKEISDSTYIVDCSVNFEDFCEHFSVTDETSESISLGGWIMEKLDKIPEENDSFEFENLTITVMETDSHRVSKVKVEIRKTETEE